MRRGTVYLVGAGPGDPKLITVRGQELLRAADVVVYDHLVSPRLLTACSPHAKLVYVGKEADRHAARQQAINRLLVREARADKTVVRLKGGDPFVFGRGGEEALSLARAKIAYEVVPGVTSAIGVPAYAGIPVTHRGLSSSFAVITGHEDPTKEGSAIKWAHLATSCDTVVCLMGVGRLPMIAAQLIRHGRRGSTPCAVIEWGTAPRQRTVTGTLRTITGLAKRATVQPPAILVVGDVTRLRRQLKWFERRLLFGKRILVTRASDKADTFADQLETLGAEVEQLPAIELGPVRQNGLLREAITGFPRPDWVFFTSPEGIGWFARVLRAARQDLRWLSGCHIGAIGSKTAAAIEERGLHVDFVPKQFSQEGVLEGLPRRVLNGKRALILCAEESRDVLAQGLRGRGCEVKKLPIYRTLVPRALATGLTTLFKRPFDYVTVTSASCVEHLWTALRTGGEADLFRRLRFASIGPVTSSSVRAHGGRVVVEANPSTIEGLVHAMVKHLR
ncbi:MAG: uroporphyrinogen-III C-methyltransferase [Candidatus Omnitrophica bacterium]|nr:uroporphyrinogen-III C-methyltransferase [Candidatus Omnitrophota bacterium]